MVTCSEPKKRWREPEALQAGIVICDIAQELSGGKNAARADQPFDLKNERVKRRKINEAERAEENPARQQMRSWAFDRSFRQQQPICGLSNTIRHLKFRGL